MGALAAPVPATAPGREWLIYGALALATHAALVTAWRHAPSEPRPVFREHIVELVRPEAPPPPVVEPPPPPPPPPPRAQQAPPPVPAPVPALRTAAASADVPAGAITIPENTTAAPTTAPAVAAPPAPPPAPPAPKVEEPVTEASANAAYLKNPAPAYPAAAQRRGLQGTVLLRVHVLPSGSADVVEVQTSSGHRLLDEAAVEAVKHWSFVPSMKGKTAQAGWARVPVEFRLGS